MQRACSVLFILVLTGTVAAAVLHYRATTLEPRLRCENAFATRLDRRCSIVKDATAMDPADPACAWRYEQVLQTDNAFGRCAFEVGQHVDVCWTRAWGLVRTPTRVEPNVVRIAGVALSATRVSVADAPCVGTYEAVRYPRVRAELEPLSSSSSSSVVVVETADPEQVEWLQQTRELFMQLIDIVQ